MRIVLRFWRLLLGALWVGGVTLLTLKGGQVGPEWRTELPWLCVICGSRGMADAILNVVLFLPLGVVLGGTRRSALIALVSGVAVSAGIELLQTLLPGRHPSPMDVLLNAAGAGLGAVVFALVRSRVERHRAVESPGAPEPEGRTRIFSSAEGSLNGWSLGAAVGACFVVAGILLTPAPTDEDYWGQWMPDLGSMPQYNGTVLSAELNGRSMPSRRLDRERPHRQQLEGDWRLEGRIVVGPEPPGVSPILSVYERQRREVLLLGAHHTALVFRQRILANRFRFDAPDVRVPGAFKPLTVGDTANLGARRENGSVCLWLAEREECGVGISAGRTWGLLLYVEGPPEHFRRLVDLLWLIGLLLPVGFFARGLGDLIGGTGAGVGALLMSTAFTPMVLGTGWEVAACVAGTALGRLVLVGLRWAADEIQAF